MILYTAVPTDICAADYAGYLSLLPPELQKKNLRFKKLNDRLLNLFGKLLLKKALEIRKITKYTLADIRYGPYNRPYFDDTMDFSISHSGRYAVCALATNSRLGIDTEEIAALPENYKDIMQDTEWEEIVRAAQPEKAFAVHWTKKESLIKADNTAIAQHLRDIDIKGRRIQRHAKTWYQHSILLNARHSTCLTTDSSSYYGYIEYFDSRYLL